jgi:hypothetical protein
VPPSPPSLGGEMLACAHWGENARRPRGSIGRSLNPLGALVPIGVGPGTQLRSEVVDGRSLRRALTGKPRSEDRSDPVTALPVSREVRIRRSAGRQAARRSLEIPVRSPDRPELRFPDPQGTRPVGILPGSAFADPYPLSGSLRVSPAASGKSRPRPCPPQTQGRIDFRDL